MKRILINASNLTGSGAQSVGLSLLPALAKALSKYKLTIILPKTNTFNLIEENENAKVLFVQRRQGFANDLTRQRELLWDIPRLSQSIGASVCLTLGDLTPIGLACPSILLFHQPLLVYNKHETSGFSGWPNYKHFYISRYFGSTVNNNKAIVVQTPVIGKRLSEQYNVDPKKIVVMPQPVPHHILSGADNSQSYKPIDSCKKPFRLLFLSAYYPHKNFAILPKLTEEIRHRGLDHKVHIFLTVDETLDHSNELTTTLKGDTDLITNLGTLDRSIVANALRSATALFLPTLVESYGLIYLEAMACDTQILTSDRDFAHWMCGDLAYYFDPLDPRSIVNSIIKLMNDQPSEDGYHQMANKRLSEFPKDWGVIAEKFALLIEQVQK